MTKINILSDIHTEFRSFIPQETDADIVILAGDIGVGMSGYEWAKEAYPDQTVLYLLGNHEYYHQDIMFGSLWSDWSTNIKQVGHEAEPFILNDTRFIACTLWTDFLFYGESRKFGDMIHAKKNMSDFRVIRGMTPQQSLRMHKNQIDRLSKEVTKPFDGKTVVITHHAPSTRSINGKYIGDPLNPAFASNLDDMVLDSGIDLWIHGHMHDSLDYQIGDTRVVCNPRGYIPHEPNPDFDPGLIIEI